MSPQMSGGAQTTRSLPGLFVVHYGSSGPPFMDLDAVPQKALIIISDPSYQLTFETKDDLELIHLYQYLFM